ncbi:MAG: chemotaxis protein [Gammaproteobacteria bacterium]|jgi:methyl-accepting chemotaxis protein|nr:chemotaxis protein [Gammaproteobacteria bacterium]
MKRWTDNLIALQYLMVVLPVTLVLIGQSVADARRANTLARSSPLQALASDVRASYKAFENGAADAVDTGALSTQSVDALAAAATRLRQLVSADPAGRFAATRDAVASLAAAVPPGATLGALMPLRAGIKSADALTRTLDETLTAENQAVIQDAIRSANLEKIVVPLAILLSIAVTAVFVLATQRRLRARLEAEGLAASQTLRIKNALDNCSVGIMVADAERSVVYANRAAVERLRRSEANGQSFALPFSTSTLIGTHLDVILDNHAAKSRATSSRRVRLELGGRIYFVSEDPVLDPGGRPVGWVIEWSDRTEAVALEQEVARIVAAAACGDFHYRISLAATGHDSVEDQFITELAGSINKVMQTSETGLKDIARVLQALVQGNLTERIESDYGGTFGELKNYSNRTTARLQEVVGHIKSAAAAIDAATDELIYGTTDLSARAETLAARIEETSNAMRELSTTVRSNADDAREADRFAAGAAAVASEGRTAVARAATTMGEISEASQKIAQIIGVVDEIAFQTNLLALNAAVEAARAGEHGRGFAVVASEVRNLASRSAAAAREIKQLIGDSVRRVSEGMELVKTAGTTMSEAATAVQRVTGLISRISAASQLQSRDIESLGDVMGQMHEATRKNTELVSDSAAAVDSLHNQAAALVASVAVFTLERADSNNVRPGDSAPYRDTQAAMA